MTQPVRTPRKSARKSWREKFDAVPEPRIVTVPAEQVRRYGGRRVLISCPRDIDALVRAVPKGKVVTVNDLRTILAARHGADAACPLTTGIFLRIIAEVAEEERAAGKRRITPYWRVLKAGGLLNAKYPGGISAQAAALRAEGHSISTSSHNPRVADFERKLASL